MASSGVCPPEKKKFMQGTAAGTVRRNILIVCAATSSGLALHECALPGITMLGFSSICSNNMMPV